VDLKDRKIRVNVVSPDPTDTPLLRVPGSAKEDSRKIFEDLAKLTVMDRLAQPIEIAKPALFLASGDSSYITGIELFIDGGASQI
jgi:NAD(P)-dependent dehydrogenase (short-subunit alcohol dehydrogenase family)